MPVLGFNSSIHLVAEAGEIWLKFGSKEGAWEFFV